MMNVVAAWMALAPFAAVVCADVDERPPAASQPDKSGYTLFDPTPRGLMREFDTDRPEVTETPYTIDAGHYQIEFSFVEYTYDWTRGIRTDSFAVLPLDLRVGVLNNLEFDLLLDPYLNTFVSARGGGARQSGFGDTTLRARLNLWGDDAGPIAFGIMPSLTLPTASGGVGAGHVHGGLVLPFSAKLPWDFELGAMAEFDADRNASNTGYGASFTHSAVLFHPLFSERLSGYIEYVGISPIRLGQTYLAFADTGIAVRLSENLQWDAGINIGLSQKANDFTVFTGLSLRI